LLNWYYDDERVAEEIEAGHHREIVGGGWIGIGPLQLEFLRAEGLEPENRLLDVGCGALRGGVHFVSFLDPGNYFGIDLSQDLLDAGYEREIIPAGLADRLPRTNLRATRDFDAFFATPVDYALAFSVFSHLPLNHLRWCLDRIETVIRPGGRFYVTFFELPPEEKFGRPYTRQPGGLVTYPGADPYHYRPADIVHAAEGTAFSAKVIGEWAPGREQAMAVFTRRRKPNAG
jgi:SAM-dependent methyltransferase